VLLRVFGGSFVSILAQAHLHGTHDDGFVVDAADEAFVHFNGVLAAKSFAIWPHQSGPEFVEDLKRGFVTRKAKLALELKCGLAWRLGGNEVCAPEPGREWCV
jgi:hypothetical protein